jgi:hypothetical protein
MRHEIENGDLVVGECLCHGVTITGTAGTIATPAPVLAQPDFWSPKRVRVWHVQEFPGAMPHDVPVSKLRLAKADA